MMQKFRLTPDIIYARHVVGFLSGATRERDMLLDVYEPDSKADLSPRPAVILVFGGAFHRGAKDADSFSLGEGYNTSVAEYAGYWASLGFVTFSIDYRLITEDPKPDDIHVLTSPETVGSQRMDQARKAMGLPPATPEMLANGVEAGAMDTDAAVSFIRKNASRWNIDTSRIALWGWSAGARNVLNAVFARGTQAASIIALSPFIHDLDLARNISKRREGPPLLIISAERDMPHIAAQVPKMVSWFRERLPLVQALKALNVDHFYPSTSEVVEDNDQGNKSTLLNAMTNFLFSTIGDPTAKNETVQ